MDLVKVVRALMFTPAGRTRWGIPFALDGTRGTAKTSLLYALTEQCSMRCEVEIPSLADPTDYRGLPVPTEQQVMGTTRRYVERLLDRKWSTLAGKRGLIFIDEATGAPPAVQSAFLRGVLERVFGDLAFGPLVRFGLAMNPAAEAAGGQELAAPLINRVVIIPWTLGFERFTEWLVTDGGDNGYYTGTDRIDPEAEERRVMALWPAVYGQWRGIGSAYAKARGGEKAVHNPPEPGTPQAARPHLTYRSFETMVRIGAAAEIHALDDDERMIAWRGAAGDAAAADFDNYVSEQDIPDCAALLDEEVEWEHNSKRIDRTLCVLEGCAGVVLATEDAAKKLRRAAVFYGIADKIIDAKASDVVKPAVDLLGRHKYGPAVFGLDSKKNPARSVFSKLGMFTDEVEAEVRS